MIRRKEQTHNDGVATLYRLPNGAKAPSKPEEQPEYLGRLRYRERTVGVTRHWAAMQNGKKVEKVLRCPRHSMAQEGCLAVIQGVQYSILQVQYPEELPHEMDLTLEKARKKYGLPEEN